MNNINSPFTVKKYMPIKHSKDNKNLIANGNILTKIEFENYFGFNDIRLALCVTMYNEDIDLLKQTLVGIYENLAQFAEMGINPENILLFIISDGIVQMNENVKKEMKLIDERPQINNPDIVNYIERVQPGDDKKIEQNLYTCLVEYKKSEIFNDDNHIDIQVDFNFILAIKELNKGKLDSHFWFFWGFCKLIDPDFIILVDCGTVPLDKSLAKLIQPMINDERLGGTCGEMLLSNNNDFFNLVTNSQAFEYKFAHKVDKHLESLFGFVTVLPGAFSAYRWSCLREGRIMAKYFLSLFNASAAAIPCSVANMYLAEDRIFCHYLFNMNNRVTLLKYLPEAIAETDAPEDLCMFMAQRRRWINGSVFALWHVMSHSSEVCESKHNIIRKFFFMILTFYFFIQTFLSYFVLGNFYFIFQILCNDVIGYKPGNEDAIKVVMSIFLFLIFFTVMISLTLKPKEGKYHFIVLGVIFTLFTIFGTIFTIKSIVDNFQTFSSMTNINDLTAKYWGVLICLFIGLANYIIPLILNPISMIKVYIFSFFQYSLMGSVYSLLLVIYSYCNIDDVSWGNRDSAVKVDLTEFKLYKLKLLIIWILSNFAYGWVFSWLVSQIKYKTIFINCFSFIIAGLIGFKIIGSTLDNLKYRLYDRFVLYKKCRIKSRTETQQEPNNVIIEIIESNNFPNM